MEQYWRFCDLLKENGVTDGKILSIPAKALLTLNRIRLGTPIEYLAVLFQISDTGFLNDVFWECAMILYNNSNAIPKLWLEDMEDTEKNKFFESYFNRLDPLYQQICNNVEGNSLYNILSKKKIILHILLFILDPLGGKRRCYPLLIDSTLVMTQKSGDFEVQKHTFSDHQKKHGFKATNICGNDLYFVHRHLLQCYL